jgi:hypothetical protein
MCLFLHHAVFLNQCVFVLKSRIGAVSGFSSDYPVWGTKKFVYLNFTMASPLLLGLPGIIPGKPIDNFQVCLKIIL